MFHPISLFKFQMYAAMTTKSQWADLLGSTETSDEDQDTLKVTTMSYCTCASASVEMLSVPTECLLILFVCGIAANHDGDQPLPPGADSCGDHSA